MAITRTHLAPVILRSPHFPFYAEPCHVQKWLQVQVFSCSKYIWSALVIGMLGNLTREISDWLIWWLPIFSNWCWHNFQTNVVICIKKVLRVKHGQQLHKFNYRHISLKTWSVSGNAVSRVTLVQCFALSVQIREIILKALPRLSGVMCSFVGSTFCVNSAMQSQWNDLSRIKDFLHHSWFWSPCIATPASILCKVWTREWKQTRASAHSAIVTYLCVYADTSVWGGGRLNPLSPQVRN